MNVLVTGANGFVGRWMVRRLLDAGHQVGAATGPLDHHEHHGGDDPGPGIRRIPLELTDVDSVNQAVRSAPWDAIVHLGAIAWSRDAAAHPARAWQVNAGGTALLVEAAGVARRDGVADPLLLLVSTCEVYGPGSGQPRTEADPLVPWSPYAATKVGAEVAAREAADRLGARLIIARPFTHTGPGQRDVFVIPALISRIRAATRSGQRTIRTGNLEPIRDFIDVRDVVEAYLLLLERGRAGEVYNIATGQGRRLSELFTLLARSLGATVSPEPDPALLRGRDLMHLVGNPSKLQAATGWQPRFSLEQTLADMIDAQAD